MSTTLFILTEEEKVIVPKEILLRGVTLSIDEIPKKDIFLGMYDNVIITEGMLKSVPTFDVRSLIKIATTFSNSKLIYFRDLNTEIDSVSEIMNAFGNANIYNINLASLNIDLFDSIISVNKKTVIDGLKDDTLSVDLSNEKKLTILLTELSAVGKDGTHEVLIKNSELIKTLLSMHKSKIEESNKLRRENKQSQNRIKLLDKTTDKLNNDINILKRKNNDKAKQLKELRLSILNTRNKIQEYNARVINSEVDEEFITDLDTKYGSVVLYFKELEDIGFYKYYESLLYSFRVVNKMYTKSIILERGNRTYYNPYTKDGYIVTGDTSSIKDIIDNDKIVHYGNANRLLSILNRPEMKVEVLMIYDRTMTDTVHVNSSRLIPMYVGKSRNSIETMEIEDEAFISPYEGDWKSIEPLLREDINMDVMRIHYNLSVSMHPLTDYLRDASVALKERG